MSHTAYTMPEAKFRSTKKRVQPASAIRTSEFAAEMKALKPKAQAGSAEVKSKIHLVEPSAAEAKASKPAWKLTSFWPVAVGLFLSGFAPEWHTMASQAGVWVMRIAFPFALLATHREIGIDSQMATFLPQLAVFAQLPIDGLMMVVAMRRSKSLKSAILQVTYIHLLCAFVLWLLTFLGK